MPIYVPGKLTLRKEFVWNESIWNPSMVQPSLWLDAADTSTVAQSGGSVSQWNDKSGNGRNVTQSIEASKPTLLADGIGGHPSLEFDGVNDQLANTAVGLPVGSSARSMFLVYRPLRLSVSNTVVAQGEGVGTGFWFALQFRQSPVGDPYFAGYARDLSSGDAITIENKMAGVTYDGTNALLYKNGTLENGAALTLNTNGDTLRVGTSPNQVEWANCLIGEIVMTSSALSTLNRQKLEGYLAHKWGLTADLPAGHPYKLVGPTP